MTAAFSEVAIRGPRDASLIFGRWLNCDLGFAQEFIQSPVRDRVAPSIYDGARLDIVHGRDPAIFGELNGLRKSAGIGLIMKNGDHRRSVDNHLGNPCSS